MSAQLTINEATPGTAVSRTIGLHGRTAVLWGMAGGIAVGGVLVAGMTLAGRLSGNAIFATSTALFIVGAMLGLIHGGVLGFAGRPAETSGNVAARQLALSLLYAIPGLAVAWLVSVWVALTLIAAYANSAGAFAGVAVGWVAAAAILSAAAIHGLRALTNAYARWPERRVGTLLVAATFAGLMVIFMADRPSLWGLPLRLTETGATLLAAFLAIWVVGPVVTVALRLARELPTPRVGEGVLGAPLTPTDVVVGMVTGLVVGLIAVPFATPSVGASAVGAVVVEVGRALVDEVFLRLFLVTAVGWVLLRWHRVNAREAAVGAVLIATVVQVALYAPGAMAIGFPAWTGTVGFLATAAVLPAIAFGALYWKRGFGTALLANMTALIAVLLIV